MQCIFGTDSLISQGTLSAVTIFSLLYFLSLYLLLKRMLATIIFFFLSSLHLCRSYVCVFRFFFEERMFLFCFLIVKFSDSTNNIYNIEQFLFLNFAYQEVPIIPNRKLKHILCTEYITVQKKYRELSFFF